MQAVRSYLLLQRDPFRGCRLGRLVHEASFEHEELRRPVAACFEAVRHRLARSLVLAQAEGTCGAGVDPENLALSLAALIEGGYVLARVFRDEELMGRAVEGGGPGSRGLNEYKKNQP